MVDGQGVALPPAAIQGSHQQAGQVLAVGMAADRRLQLSDHRVVAAQPQPGLEARLQRIQPEVVQATGLELRPVLIRHVGEGRASPEVQCFVQDVGRASSLSLLERPPAFPHSRFERLRVQIAGADREPVAAGHRVQRRAVRSGGKGLAQTRDRHVHALVGPSRPLGAPQHVAQPVGRDGFVGMDQEEAEQPHLSRAPGRHRRGVLVVDLDRTQDPNRRMALVAAYAAGAQRPLPARTVLLHQQHRAREVRQGVVERLGRQRPEVGGREVAEDGLAVAGAVQQ